MEASAMIQEKADEDAKVVIGALYDDALGDEMQVTVIATGVGAMLDKKETISPMESRKKKPAAEKTTEKPAPKAPAEPKPAAAATNPGPHGTPADTPAPRRDSDPAPDTAPSDDDKKGDA